MPRDHYPVREARQEFKSLLGIIDDQIKRVFDCMRPLPLRTPREVFDKIVEAMSEPPAGRNTEYTSYYSPWNRTNAELFGKSPIKTYTREEQTKFEEIAREEDRQRRLGLAPVITEPYRRNSRNETPRQAMEGILEEYGRLNQDGFRREYACDFVSPYAASEDLGEISAPAGSEVNPHAEPQAGDVMETEDGVIGVSDGNGNIIVTDEARVRAGETIAIGSPVVVGSHNHHTRSPTSPKMPLSVMDWQPLENGERYRLTFKCTIPETMQTLTGRMVLTRSEFDSLRTLMGNWPTTQLSITINDDLYFNLIDENDHVLTRMRFTEFGVEDEAVGVINPITGTTNPPYRGLAGTMARQISVPHLAIDTEMITRLNLMTDVLGIPSRPYGESAVAPLRKQKYPPMECALCEDVIDEPENMRTFLGPRQMVKYLKACKHLNQQPQLFCCKCFGIIKSKPKFMKTYTAMMNSYKAFKKAEAEARKVLK